MTLEHPTPVDTSQTLRFILGSGKEFEPVVARLANRSVWINLVADDKEEDLEHIATLSFYQTHPQAVWPELLENTSAEKIRVRPKPTVISI